ncbi:MAG: outer membrane lipoprotein-sorting protein [Lentisphaeria bacterium]
MNSIIKSVKLYFQPLVTTTVLTFSGAVFAQAESQQPAEKGKQLSVAQIVDKSNWRAYYQGQDGRARVKMTITEKDGDTRNREFTILRRDSTPEDVSDKEFTGEQNFYVYFHRPADVNGMVFMVWKHLDSDDDRWLYLPALDLVKRIAASDKRTSFVGSNFFYEDVSGRSVNLDKHQLVEETDTYYKLKNIPKNPQQVEFDHYIMWIHKESFIPVKTEYYDDQGTKYRVYEALKVEPIEDFLTVTKSRMSNLKSGGNTVLEYSNVKYNLDLPDNLFTERYLRRAPRKYLR